MVICQAFLLPLLAIATGSLHGGWSDWEPWGLCTVPCGGGKQGRIRTCLRPPCTGHAYKTKQCNVVKCSIGLCYDLCSEHVPCQNGGSCLEEEDGLNRCYCTSEWTGPHCNTPLGEKVRQPCLTHCSKYIPCEALGICVKQKDGKSQCQCHSKMDFGAHCETYFREACWGDGNYTDPLNCNGFVECINGLPYRKSCPGENRFDAETNKCEPPENVSCD